MSRILICDDERDILAAMKIYLEAEGHETVLAENGKQAVEQVEKSLFHLVILDLMMPVMDGLTAMVKIREKSNVPIILLTAKSEDSDKILGLSVGADDYVTKPFHPAELMARVKAQLRRYLQLGNGGSLAEVLRCGGVEMNLRDREVFVEGEKTLLTPTEYDLLQIFLQNPGKVFSLKELYCAVWKESPHGSEGTVAVHIRHLREKIEINPAEPRYIKVVWGQGYRLEVQNGEMKK